MAVLYATGFEAGSLTYYNQSEKPWYQVSGGNGTNMNSVAANQHRTATGVGGNYCVDVDDQWETVTGIVALGVARWFHCWMKPGPGGGNLFMGTFQNGTRQFGVRFESNGNITMYRGVTLVSTTIGAHVPTVPHWVAVEILAQEAGICNVYVDNVLAATFSGDTRNTTTDGWDSFGFAGASFGNDNYFVDDVIITDNTTGKLLEQVCAPLVPNGDTAQADLTPSTGTDHYAMVDEVPFSDTDYNAATAAGQEDRYDFTDLPAGVASVTFAVFTGRATRDGSITKGEVSVRSGVTTVYNTPVQLPAAGSYLDIRHIRETDPDTAAQWTAGGINSVKAGYRFTS